MAVYVAIGPCGECSECSKDTFIARASVSGEVSSSKWLVKTSVVTDISESLVKNYRKKTPTVWDYERAIATREPIRGKARFRCPSCSKIATRFYWAELEDVLAGPVCFKCLRVLGRKISGDRRQVVDYPMYTVAATKGNLVRAKTILELSDVSKEEQETEGYEVVLF